MTDSEMVAHLNERVRNFKGDVTELERAIGAYLIGRQVGWKALLVIHDLGTIERFERVLGLKFEAPALPADSPYPPKTFAWLAAFEVEGFWGAVMREARRARTQR